MSTPIEIFNEQLLYGQKFISEFEKQLNALYSDAQFMALVHRIQKQSPSEECLSTIEEIKRIAKTTLYNENAAYNFDALKSIVDAVAERGKAKNSALISVYCAMRIFELSSVSTSADISTEKSTCANETSKTSLKSEMDFRLKWPAEYRCEDGHYVRSKNEALVDNWLYNHFVAHAYEKAVFSADTNCTYCSDFFLPQYHLFIEIWGMSTTQYEEKKQRKIAFYKHNGYDLLDIFGDDVKNLDDILSKHLRKLRKK